MAILMLSQGVPMILAGDEILRTQQGNNNCYCQDNALSWFDWNLLEENKEMFSFTKGIIALRKRHPCLWQNRFLKGIKPDDAAMADISWHGAVLGDPQWENSESRVLAFTLSHVESEEEDFHVMINMSNEDLVMELPPLVQGNWHLAVDTSASIKKDIVEQAQQLAITKQNINLSSYTIIVCESR